MTPASAIRVLLALDGLAADLLAQRLESDDGFEVIGRTRPSEALSMALAQDVAPDFVVLPAARDEDCPATALLDAVPHVQILSLEIVGGRAYLTGHVGDQTPHELTDALRHAAGRSAG